MPRERLYLFFFEIKRYKFSDEKAKVIDQRIFDLYGLTQEERDAIGYIDFHNNGEETDDE